MYVQFSKKSSDQDKNAHLIELSDQPSTQRVSWYIQQRYNYRTDGEEVVFNDHIILYNSKYNSYMHVNDHTIQNQIKS